MINTSLFGLSQKNRDKFSSVKEQAFIHAWLLLVEVFFKGVHLECEKKPIHIIHFIGYLSAK
jgi:hypothetical protein